MYSLPIYEYECLECGREFETIQKITEEPLTSCPSCSGKVRKLVSNCSFQLKGTGWYLTDYARKSDGKEERKEKKEEKKGTKKDKKEKSDKAESKAKSKETTPKKVMNQ